MGRILTRDEALGWTREHGQRINAGDAAAILWESPFDSAYQCWARKLGFIPKKEQTKEMLAGNVTEPAIFAWYESIKKVSGGKSQTWCAYSEAEFIQAKADYFLEFSDKSTRPLLAEFKSPQRDDSKDHLLPKEQRIVPYHYWLQCQHTLACFEVEWMDFVSWCGPDDYVILPVQFDQEFWSLTMLPAYMEFYERLESKKWGKPAGNEDMTDNEEWAMQCRRYYEAKAYALQYSEQADRAHAAICRMAAATGKKAMVGGGVKALWVEWKPTFDVTIKAETAEARDKIVEACRPLEGKGGVKDIKPGGRQANLSLRISRAE